jgi:hypothetical protein
MPPKKTKKTKQIKRKKAKPVNKRRMKTTKKRAQSPKQRNRRTVDIVREAMIKQLKKLGLM